ALRGTYHCQGDASIARSGFDHCLARLERAAALCIFDDGNGQSILDGRERIEELALHIHRHIGRREAIDPHDGSTADGAENAVVDHGGYRSVTEWTKWNRREDGQ